MLSYASSRWFVTPYAVEGADVSTGVGAHEPKLQAASSERLPHAVPPCAAYVVVVCVRVSKPGPHALLQSP